MVDIPSRQAAGASLLGLAALTSACAVPFETSYYALEQPRLVAISAPSTALPGADGLTLTVLVYEPGFLPLERTFRRAWFVPRDGSAACVAGVASIDPAALADDPSVIYLGEGVDLRLRLSDHPGLEELASSGTLRVAVGVSGPDGFDQRGYVTLSADGQGAPTVLSVSRALIPELTLAGGEERWAVDAWTADARRGYQADSSLPWIPEGSTTRIALGADDAEGDDLGSNWLAAYGAGTPLALGELSIDWVAGYLHEEEESGLLRSELLPPGHYTLAALVLDQRGGASFKLLDVDVLSEGVWPEGLAQPLGLAAGARTLWLDAGTAEQRTELLSAQGVVWVAGELERREEGLVLTGAHLAAPSEGADPWGALALGCPELDGSRPFTLDDLSLGRCVWSELEGREVLLQGEVVDVSQVMP